MPASRLLPSEAWNNKGLTRTHPRESSSGQRAHLTSATQTSMNRSLSPLHISQFPDSMIGVALGSPGQSPLSGLPAGEASYTDRSPNLYTRSPYDLPSQDIPQSKGGRWKGLGGLFGKKSGPSQQLPTSSPQNKHASPPRLGGFNNYHKPRTPQISPTPSDNHGVALLDGQNKPSRDWIGPAQLPQPEMQGKRNVLRKTSLRRNHLSKRAKNLADANIRESSPQVRHHEADPGSVKRNATREDGLSQKPLASGALLQVEIPNIELERYSVMFSSLLVPSQQSSRQPSPNRQSSLLARRQANLPEVQTTSPPALDRPWMHQELSSNHRTRSPSKSPSFSLFPPSPDASGRKNHNTAREPSPLQRSATVPVAVSPSKAKFDFFQPTEHQDQVILIVHTPSNSSDSRRHSYNNEDSTSQTSSQALPPTNHIVRRTPSPHQTAYSPRSRSRSRSQGRQRAPKDPLKKAAEISIARQISISRQQRKMLVPASKQVPQPVQPRIVDEREGRMARKSHHLVLEDA